MKARKMWLLETAKKKYGISYRDIASELNISHTYISKALNGSKKLGLKNISKLLDILQSKSKRRNDGEEQ